MPAGIKAINAASESDASLTSSSLLHNISYSFCRADMWYAFDLAPKYAYVDTALDMHWDLDVPISKAIECRQ
uniref:Uncharacterized protein n=1 Tax=Gibberella zeae TaxID=5518 RepID=A0A4E9ENZ3_GIBZA